MIKNLSTEQKAQLHYLKLLSNDKKYQDLYRLLYNMIQELDQRLSDAIE